MARKRMISPNIWQDPDFGMLDSDGQILFLGLISNADDEGRLRGHSAYLKSIVFVYKDYSIKKVERIRNDMIARMKNVTLYIVNNEEYIQLKNWDKYQTLREDRVVPSTFPSTRSGVVADIMPTSDGQVTAEEKGREVSISEVKISKDKYGEFGNVFLKIEEFQKLMERLGEKGTHQLIGELDSGIESKGYKYKSHYATILNWANRRVTTHQEKISDKKYNVGTA